MKAQEIRELSDNELQQRLDESAREAFHLRVQQATGQLENPARLCQIRRDVARMNTIMSERKQVQA